MGDRLRCPVPDEWLTAAEAAEAPRAERRDGRLRIRRQDLSRPSPTARAPAPHRRQPKVPPMEDWVSTTVARQYLGGITPGTMYRMLKSGEISAQRVGRYIFIERQRIDPVLDAAGSPIHCVGRFPTAGEFPSGSPRATRSEDV